MKKAIDEKEVLIFIYQNIESTFKEMQAYFDVSQSTLRRVLLKLKSKKWLNFDKNKVIYMPFEHFQYEDKKSAIITNSLAYKASKLINNNETICLGGGSTNVALIFPFILLNNSNVIIVSNSILVLKFYLTFIDLAISKNITLLNIGGTIQKTFYSFGGEYADNVIKNCTIDKTFLGAFSIDINRGVFSSILNNNFVERLFIEVSTKSYLVAASSKFNQKSFYKWADFDDFDGIITDYQNIKLDTRENFTHYKVNASSLWDT